MTCTVCVRNEIMAGRFNLGYHSIPITRLRDILRRSLVLFGLNDKAGRQPPPRGILARRHSKSSARAYRAEWSALPRARPVPATRETRCVRVSRAYIVRFLVRGRDSALMARAELRASIASRRPVNRPVSYPAVNLPSRRRAATTCCE